MKNLLNLTSLTKWCFTMIVAMLLFSCEKDSYAPPFQEIVYDKFAGQLFEKEVNLKEDIQKTLHDVYGVESFEQLVAKRGYSDANLKSNIEKLNLFIKMAPKYNIHGITYHTIDPFGNPIVASGVIYYPKKMKPKGVILISPTLKTKGYAGTDIQLAYEAFPGLTGYVCIIPDGIGLGTTANLPLALMQHDNTVRITTDMQLATKEFLHNHYRYDMPRETFLLGYSLGGHGIWSIARHYQQHPELGFKANDIFVGGGTYQPEIAVEHILEFDHAEYAINPYIIWSFDQYGNLNLDFTQIFKGKLLEGIPELCNGEKSVIYTTSYIGTDVHEYMVEDFLRNKNNPQRLLLLEALKKNAVPNDWTPKAKIHLYHSANDSISPTICGDFLNNYLESVNANVTYHRLEQDHFECAISMALDAFNFFKAKK